MLYPDFWVVTDDLRYPGYKTPTAAPKSSVQWMAKAIHLTEGRICTHMLLWVLSRDSMMWPWG
jgi:hypothetical protein